MPMKLLRLCSSSQLVQWARCAGQRQTIGRVGSHWMPLLQQLGVSCPVILCSCKSDLEHYNNAELEEVNLHAQQKPGAAAICNTASAAVLPAPNLT